MNEGAGLTGLSLASDTDPRVRLSGVLWQKPVRLQLDPSRRETQLWEGLLVASPLADALTDPEKKRLSMKAKIASDFTSFVFATAGARNNGIGLGMVGTSSRCGGCRMHSTGRLGLRFPQPEAWLEKQMASAYQRCGGTVEPAVVSLDTTKNEIVDVGVATKHGKLGACLEAASWDLETPEGFGVDAPSAQFSIELP